MPYFVAIDGGGTNTRCWLADEAHVLGRAETGTIKLMNVPEETAAERLRDMLEEAAKQAGVALRGVAGTCMGLAGSSSASVRGWAETALRRVVGGEVLVCGDVEIGLEAAFRGGPGLLVIAGTGSNVMGRCADGRTVQAGGWGPMLGDEGSGYWIGLEATRAALRAEDRGVESCLLREIVRHWNLRDEGELVAYANRSPRAEFAELAPLVARCAQGGDALAAGVLQRAGTELAAQVSLAASKMHQEGCAAEDALRVAFAGSVLEKIARVRRAMEEALVGLDVASEAVEPLEGAMYLAKQLVSK